jgi:hypothetical protein
VGTVVGGGGDTGGGSGGGGGYEEECKSPSEGGGAGGVHRLRGRPEGRLAIGEYELAKHDKLVRIGEKQEAPL